MRTPANPVRVGILVLDYHHPEETVACVRSLLEAEGPETRVLWLENDAERCWGRTQEVLQASGLDWIRIDAETGDLPAHHQLGVITNAENLGYAGGNNVGLRFLHRHGVEFAWVLNNDTQLLSGTGADLVRASEARPEVGLWGMRIVSRSGESHVGGLVQAKDFAARPIAEARRVEGDPLAYISGCAMFFPVSLGAELGFIPEDYFLYYEDLAFSFEIRRAGKSFGVVEPVSVLHDESLSTGRRSPLMEYYNRRNRWRFIERYFPERLRAQEWRFFLYQLQKLLFRLRFDRLRLEWCAYRDYKRGRMGRTSRSF